MFCLLDFNIYGSASLFFVFICKLDCSITEDQARHLLFEILTEIKILERFDTSDKFWKKFQSL